MIGENIATLQHKITEGKIEESLTASEELARLTPIEMLPHIDLLLYRLRYDYAHARIIRIFQNMKSKEVLQLLIEKVDDPNHEFRLAAAEILGYMQDKSAVSHLLPLIQVKHKYTRGIATEALQRLKEDCQLSDEDVMPLANCERCYERSGEPFTFYYGSKHKSERRFTSRISLLYRDITIQQDALKGSRTVYLCETCRHYNKVGWVVVALKILVPLMAIAYITPLILPTLDSASTVAYFITAMVALYLFPYWFGFFEDMKAIRDKQMMAEKVAIAVNRFKFKDEVSSFASWTTRQAIEYFGEEEVRKFRP